MEKTESIDVKVYYQSLKKKEKSEFLKYLMQRYDYKARTIGAKLGNKDKRYQLRRDEEENIVKTIESGVWRQ